SVPG
ncbi:hlyD secretion family protein, partial [Vibrio parahaemolyticus VPTS-2010_2]